MEGKSRWGVDVFDVVELTASGTPLLVVNITTKSLETLCGTLESQEARKQRNN